MVKQQSRILRNYRNMPPTKFFVLNQSVRKSLAENQRIPQSTWASNPDLIAAYFKASDKHEAVYHEACYGSCLVIAERDVLQKQLVIYLDEIAADLEAEAVRNPEILLSSGFDFTKDRRSSTRKKAPVILAEAITGEHQGNNP